MKKQLLIFVLILSFYSHSFGQLVLKNPPWETGCDSLTSQTEMNICSGEKLHIADSILTAYYDQLITHVDSNYQVQLKQVKSTPDKAEKKYLKELRNQKTAVIKSKQEFYPFSKSTTAIISIQYEGGSMRPMAVNTYALEMTVNQIKVVLQIMHDLGVPLASTEEFWTWAE